jgi:hypothetical protein
MGIAALVTYLVTAVFGFVMLALWATRGGLRPAEGTTVPTRLSAPLVFGHFLLAAAGLVIWIIYLVTSRHVLTWVTLIVLVVVALGGALLFGRWLGARHQLTPEAKLPVPVVYGHGLVAVATVILVLLTALRVGGAA